MSALAVHELHGHPRVRRDDVLALERPQLLEAHDAAPVGSMPAGSITLPG